MRNITRRPTTPSTARDRCYVPPRMKIVHAADLHIDSPLRGLERYEGAPAARIRGATREAFTRIVDLCIAEGASFLVLAGDIFDGEWKDFNTGLFFKRELGRLRAVGPSGCRVLMVRGNHDAPSELLKSLEHADHVYEFGHKRPETRLYQDEHVAFHGVSYPKREVTNDLVPDFPKPVAGVLNIGILHTNAVGNAAHAAYAPCTVSELVAKGYHYWALGHVHEHAVLHERPWVVYPGNSQGRNAREHGAKGCVVITAEGDQIVAVERRDCDVMRFAGVTVTLGRDDDRAALLDKARVALDAARDSAGGRLVAVRLTVDGATAAHGEIARDAKRRALVADLRGVALDCGDGVWLEKVVFETRPATPLASLRDASDLVGELLRRTDALRTNGAELARLGSGLDGVRKKLAQELEEAGVDLTSEAGLLDLLAEAEALLAQRLTEDGAA